MSTDKQNDPDLGLIKNLIELNGLSISKAAKLMSIQRPNLSSWLNGKQNVFSISKIEGMLEALGMRAISSPSTGIRLRYLSPDIVHRWQVEEGAQSLMEVLGVTDLAGSLEWLELFQVNTDLQGRFNILRSKRENGEWMMLVSNRDAASKEYPLTPETLGIARLAGTIEIPLEKWIAWLKEVALPMTAFRDEILGYIGTDNTGKKADNETAENESMPVELQLNECQRTVEELKAIIQEFIHEMRRVDPGNRLLRND